MNSVAATNPTKTSTTTAAGPDWSKFGPLQPNLLVEDVQKAVDLYAKFGFQTLVGMPSPRADSRSPS